MTLLSGQNGLQWTDAYLKEYGLVGPLNARIARAVRHVDQSMRPEILNVARRLVSQQGYSWPSAVELVTAVTLSGGSLGVFVAALEEIKSGVKGMNGS